MDIPGAPRCTSHEYSICFSQRTVQWEHAAWGATRVVRLLPVLIIHDGTISTVIYDLKWLEQVKNPGNHEPMDPYELLDLLIDSSISINWESDRAGITAINDNLITTHTLDEQNKFKHLINTLRIFFDK